MAIDESTLLRAGGLSAIAAIVALIVSGITVALFFGGAGSYWGPVNDLATAVTLVALLLPVVAVDRLARLQAGIWLDVVTVAAIAGIVLAAVGQLLLVAGAIDLETSFVTGGVGIVPVFAWLAAVAILALGLGVLPAHVGWLALGVIVLSAGLTVIAGAGTGPTMWIAAVALLAVLAGWMASLGMTLLDRGAAAA
ncbi:MAG: hypothetical protein A2V85_09320 [Chloroflexi bacterium RBG_16_72_14]|nr:MAG: hypothetical protein A2V85_09320 [Chloroflexi bacterium RBG_16_72_14]